MLQVLLGVTHLSVLFPSALTSAALSIAKVVSHLYMCEFSVLLRSPWEDQK